MSIETPRNKTFTVLSCIGIILVMLGHLDFDVLTFGGLFPYYSYHVLIFVFIAGYFYKPEEEQHIGAYLLRKAKKLLLPYYIFNLIFALVTYGLRLLGFDYGGEIDLYNLLLAPIMGGHHYMLLAPAWFAVALFLLEACNIIARRLLSLIKINNEYLLMALYLAVGIAAVWLAKRGSVYDYYKVPGRLMLMAPALQFGRLYRAKLEEHDNMKSLPYFGILAAVNLLLTVTQGSLAYSVVWVSGFAGSPLLPFITAFTGIMLWLRISKILAGAIGNNRLVNYMGSHTFALMSLHLTVFFMVTAILVLFGANVDMEQFKSSVYYAFTPPGVEGFKWIYMAAGVMIVLGVSRLYEMIKNRLVKR